MKTLLSLFLISLGLSSFGAERKFLGVEVVCKSSLSQVVLKDLCGSKKKCGWSLAHKSGTAAVWKFQKSLMVKEIPRTNSLKLFFYDGSTKTSLNFPWCKDLKSIELPKDILKKRRTLVEKKELIYLLPKEDSVHLKRLKRINHPCRKLKSSSYKGDYSFYFLEPQPLKACP